MATSISGGGVSTTSTSAALRRRQQRPRQVNHQRQPSRVEARAEAQALPEGVTFLLNWCVRVELHARRRAAQAAQAPSQVSLVNSYGA